MQLHQDWRVLLRHAWSIRLMVAAAILSGLEVALPIIQPWVPVPDGVFGVLSGLTTAAAFVSRLVAQRKFIK